MRRINLVKLIFILIATSCGWAAHAAAYTVAEIPPLSGTGGYSWPYGINNYGQVVGYSPVAMGNHAFVWSASSGIRDLGDLLGGGDDSNARSINDQGQIAGYGLASTGYHAVLWDSVGMHDLGDLPGGADHSEAYSINENGHIAGLANTTSGQHPFLWSPGIGMQDLGIPAGATTALAQGINESDSVVGTAFYTDHISAFRWTSGSGFQDLGDLSSGAWTSYAFATNKQGLVVGRGNVTVGDRGVLWHADGGMIDLGVPSGGYNSYAYAVNRLGYIVGDTTGTAGHHAAVWKDPRAASLDLNSAIDPASGWLLIQATGVNDVGQIVGIGINPAGNLGGFILTPQPSLTAFWPGNQADGFVIFLFGAGFIPYNTQVTFNDIPSPGVQWMAGDLVLALLPPGVSSGPVKVTTAYGSATAPVPFGAASSGLSVSGVWPGQGAPGSVIFVFGSGFVPQSQVYVNDVQAPAVQYMNSNLLLFLLPPAATSGPVKVVNPGGTATSLITFVVL